MKTGINLPLADHSTLEEYVSAAETCGFTHVSLSCPLASQIALEGSEALKRFETLLVKHRLNVDWVHVPFRETHFYHPLDEFRVHALSTARLFMEIARRLGAVSIVCHPVNHLPPGNGIVDFEKIVEKLRGAGFDGVWCLEIAMENTGRHWDIDAFVRYAKDRLSRILNLQSDSAPNRAFL